jgi:hypothetical protein
MEDLNTLGQRFALVLGELRDAASKKREADERAERVHVVGAGGLVTAAYEQLRNAAEYADEHLLLQKAIRRFYKRMFFTQSADFIAKSADELVTELTFAEYLQNDSVTESTVQEINRLAASYHHVYAQIQSSRTVGNSRGDTWAIDVLSVEVARLFRDTSVKEAFVQFSFDHFKQTTDLAALFGGISPVDAEPALYVAVHRALIKSDLALVRAALLRRYNQSPNDFAAYCNVNAEINRLFDSETTEKLTHYVDRQGAPLRILFRMLDSGANIAELLPRKNRFLSSYEEQVNAEYKSINKRINRGIIKSVIFLIITKVLIGLAIEVPYDFFVSGGLIWESLLINLFFPPVYMVLLRTTLSTPSEANTKRLVAQTEEMLYGTAARQISRVPRTTFGAVYNFVYFLLFLIVFSGVSWLLMTYFSFAIPHLIVFFIFLSGASFLGFRLSRMIREVEAVDSLQNSITVLRDFIYMPFVVAGRWMSEKYAQVNFVSMILDMAIELPLKSILRMIRQWSSFISSKKDQL